MKDKEIYGEEIYAALSRRDSKMVRRLCGEIEEGPFLALTKRRYSVLQMALYSAQVDLAVDLLNDAEQRWSSQEIGNRMVMDVSSRKDTILHAAATHDDCIRVVKKIFEHATQMLLSRNEREENPIFDAVLHGQLKMFDFLNRKFIEAISDQEFRLSMYRVCNEKAEENYNILHVAIYNEHFELALYIATTYPRLISQRDHNHLTSLQLLAMNTAAYNTEDWKRHKLLFPCPFPSLVAKMKDKYASDDDFKRAADVDILRGNAMDGNFEDDAVGSSYKITFPCWSRNKKEYRKYHAAELLGSFLVKKDTSWIDMLVTTSHSNSRDVNDEPKGYTGSTSAETPSIEKYAGESNQNRGHANDKAADATGGGSSQINPPEAKKSVTPPNPLVLATKYGCVRIALDILEKHPEAVEETDSEGSVLHLAIKYRRTDIIKKLLDMPMQMPKLIRWKDPEGNSILHMVALNPTKAKLKKGTDSFWEVEVPINETRSPAFELQEDLLLFERMETILKNNYHIMRNNDDQRPDQLFAERKEALRVSAQDHMKRTAENCSLVAILIATVAFAAAYTVPGGTDNGSPILLNKTFFVVFTIADVLSLASTLSAIVIFLSIMTSPFRFQDFKVTLPRNLVYGIACLIFSLAMMMLAFAATIILMIKDNQQWTKIALYGVAFLPVTMLIASYMPFYVHLRKTVEYTKDKVKDVLPRIETAKSYPSITKKHVPLPDLEQGKKCSCSRVFSV